MPRHKPLRALGLLATLALAVPLTTTLPSSADAAAATAQPPLTLWAPKAVTAYAFRAHTWTDLGLRLIANDGPVEVYSTRASYDDPIQTVWRSADGDVTLPSSNTFSGLKRFLTLTIDPRKKGEPTRELGRSACLNGYAAQRVQPDAPATSPYPYGCWYNAYSLGAVQGIQQGWANPILENQRPLPIRPGRYTVTVTVRPAYATAFGLSADQASRTIDLTVQSEKGGEFRAGPSSTSAVARPAAHRPTGRAGAREDGPRPDLRALPAWGIGVTRNDHLSFSATVWNAGDSPLVVDGFRREGEDVMDAYQYFFDASGEQVGYQKVGAMEWDPRPSHQHWHFEDFARYTLVDKDKTEIARSKKEAFCLANTDPVDLTVPDAEWRPDNTDLATACGDYTALSTREVLASGWGDTYMQYRAGQSFNLEGLPNGVYYVKVEANPEGNLVESDTTNNVSYRRIRLGGKPGHRTVKVAQVGMIDEEGYGGTG